MSDRPSGETPPNDVQDRIRRARKAMLRDAPMRWLCQHFEKGESYHFITGRGKIDFQPTVGGGGGGKPPHRVRLRRNYIRPIIEAKVSAATQRVPSYDISPSTTDPADAGAARLSSDVALYGYDKWRLRAVSIDVCKLAIGHGGDGFAMPYFEPNVGPYTLVDGEMVGQGEIRVLTFSGNEVYWEPGIKFEDSPYWCIEQARSVDTVRQMAGYVGGKLEPDASTSNVPTDKADRENLVMVTEYLERPSPKFPNGRRIVMAGGRIIIDPRLADPTMQVAGPWEHYPLVDAHGQVLDEPVLHRLKYTHDPDTDRDFGLTWQLIDFQRTAQDADNKMVEWKNRCLVPQWWAPMGTIVDKPNDVPGAIFQYRGINPPQQIQVQPIPDSLFRIKDDTLAGMRSVAQDIDLDASQNSAARTLQQVVEQSANRWQSFLGDLAEWHSRLMRHCLLLVARHYTEPRLLQIKGRYGAYSVTDFRGAQLLGEMNVTVLPGSLTVKSHEQITQQVMTYAQMGWIDGQTAMAAIQGGNAEKIIEGYELSVGRANRIVQKIIDGSIMDMPSLPMTDPATGGPVLTPVLDPAGQPVLGPDGVAQQEPTMVPAWMPRDYDKPEIWKHVLSDFLQTETFEQLPEEMQAVGQTIYDGILKVQADQQQRAAIAQQQQAEGLGMANAAGPQTGKQMPSLPGSAVTPLPGGPPQQ